MILPNEEAAKPVQVWLREGMREPDLKKSVAGKEGPDQARLRAGTEKPRLVKSESSGRKPSLARPATGNMSPRRAKLRTSMEDATAAWSDEDGATSVCEGLLRKMKESGCMKSETDARKPEQPKL